MALKLKFAGREEVPAELQSLYVERDGAWHLDVEPGAAPHPAFGHPLPSDGRGAALHAGPLPKADRESKPRERWTIRDEMEAREAQTAQVRLDAAVRECGRRAGATAEALENLVRQARVTFRTVNGRAVPVAADGRTVLLTADGSRALTVEEWARDQMAKAPEGFARRRADAGCEDAAMPLRNPFKRKFWNLTEQMRLRKADPEFAAKLKAEAWQEEN